ncbi:ferrous iron transport protein A [Blautia schinkii]|nr:ferrous iron transport protein A [Blautia schinkii]
MTLLNTQKGKWYQVRNIEEKENVQRRLEALGILTGTRVLVLNQKKSGSTIIRVRGTRWAIGRDIAEGIVVEDYDEK